MHPEFRNYLSETYTNPECQRIIYGVLKRLHINYYHQERADFEQDARLLMAEAMVQFAATHVEPVIDRDQVRNLYLYQHLYWRLLDKIRARQRQALHHQLSIDQFSASDDDQLQLEKILKDFSAERFFVKCETDEFFTTLIKQLTTKQRRYLQMIYLGYSQSEIADRLQISKQAVANLRRRVIESGRRLLNNNGK